MAKFTISWKGDDQHFLAFIKKTILDQSPSATLEEEQHYTYQEVKVYLQAYERYSFIGENRLTLSLLLVATPDQQLNLTLMTTGGSQALYHKINTRGETNFLSDVQEYVTYYIKKTKKDE